MKRIFYLPVISLMLLCGCQQTSQDSASAVEPNSTDSLVDDKANARIDSLEDVADKMREEGAEPTNSIEATLAPGWKADKNLNTVREVTLKNTSNNSITGVKLVYLLKMSKNFEERPMGQFKLKVKLKPHATTTLRIPARRFGVSDGVIEGPSWTSLMTTEKIFASVIYFSNGSVETNSNPEAESSSTL